MHTFINSRAMAQMVALDLMAEEARRSGVRRGRRGRRSTRRARPNVASVVSVEAGPRRWWMARALRLLH
jgi:hypothetical protein